MPGGQDRGDTGRELDIAVGQHPGEPGVVEVDPEDAVSLGFGVRCGQAVVELAALDVHRDVATGEVPHPAGMIIVQVRQRDHRHLLQGEPDLLDGLDERVTATRRQLGLDPVPVESAVEQRIPDKRRVEAGVEQQPAVVHLEQDRRHRLAQPDAWVGAEHRHGLGQVLPAEGQRDDPAHAHTVRSRGSAQSWARSTRALTMT